MQQMSFDCVLLSYSERFDDTLIGNLWFSII